MLVAPKEHRVHVVRDFDSDEYAQLQRLIHRVGLAVMRAVPTERLYLGSLGSNEGNSHVHWHVAPLPPSVPYEEQQREALDWSRQGILDLSEADRASLVARIRIELETT